MTVPILQPHHFVEDQEAVQAFLAEAGVSCLQRK